MLKHKPHSEVKSSFKLLGSKYSVNLQTFPKWDYTSGSYRGFGCVYQNKAKFKFFVIL